MTLTDAFQAVYEYATRESNSDPDLPEFLTGDTKPTTMERPDAAYARLTGYYRQAGGAALCYTGTCSICHFMSHSHVCSQAFRNHADKVFESKT